MFTVASVTEVVPVDHNVCSVLYAALNSSFVITSVKPVAGHVSFLSARK